ncbi:MAG: hypothetical protein BM485_05750 [Desulfobulbaceae bacterium DB1]|nr:MAG: hypothetical protein BM485_05750 [Desulfobulbaceae bacterium DB1]
MKLFSLKKSILLLSSALAVFFVLLLSVPSVQKHVVEQIGSQAGFDLLVEDMDGNIFTHLTCAGINGTRRHTSHPLSGFAVRNLRIAYSLPHLVYGIDSFLSTMRIEAERVQVVVDSASAGEISAPKAAGSGAIVLPRVLPGLRVNDVTLEILAPDYTLTLANAFLAVAAPAGSSGQAVRLDIPLLRLDRGGREHVTTDSTFRLHYREDGLRIENVTMPGTIASLQGELHWENGDQTVVWDLRAELGGGNLQSSGSVTGNRTDLRLLLENLDVAALSGLLSPADFPLSGKVSGSASLGIDAGSADSLAADVDLALTEGELLGEKISFLLQGGIRDNIVSVRKVAGNFGANEVTMEAGRVPLSLFSAWDIGLLGSGDMQSVRLQLRDIPALLGAIGQDVPLEAVPEHTLELQGSLGAGTVHIAAANFTTAKNSLLLTEAELRMPAAGRSFLDSPFAGVLRFHLTDMSELSALAGLPQIAGSGRGDAVVGGTLAKPLGTVTLEGANLSYGACRLGDAVLRARADSTTVQILSLVLRNGDDILEAAGNYLFDSGTFTDVKGAIAVKDVGRYTGSCLAMEEAVAGDLQAVFSTTGAGELQVDLALNDAVFPGIGLFSAEGVMTTDRQRYRIEDGEIAAEFGTLRFSSLVVPEPGQRKVRAELDGLTFSFNGADFSLEKPAAFILSYGAGMDLEVGETILSSAVGHIVMQGTLSLEGESALRIEAKDLTSSGWLDEFTGTEYRVGGADILFTLHGPLVAPKASLVSHIATITCPQLLEPLWGEINFAYAAGAGFSLRKFELATAQGRYVSLSGFIPFDPLAENQFLPPPISLTGSVTLPGLQGPAAANPVNGMMEGELSGAFHLSGSWENPAGEMSFTGSNLFLHHFFKDAPQEPFTVDCLLRYHAREILLDHLTVQAKPFFVKAQGKWTDIPTLAALIRRPPAGLPGRLAFLARLDMPDVGWLSPHIGGLRRLSGRLETILRADGPAEQPKFTGTMTLEQGGVRLQSAAWPALDRLTMVASLDGGVVHLDKMSGRFGGAPVALAGDIALTGDGAPLFDLRLTGSNLLFYRDETMKIRGDADLRLQGPQARLRLGGKILLTDCRYGKNVDFLSMFRSSAKVKADTGMQFFSFSEPPLRDMVFDIEAATGEKPFLIANNMARGAARPALRLIGTGEIPVLVGRIYVEPTNISVPAGKIVVESGIITFPENDPDRPTFDIRAVSRLAGYDITLHLQGTSDEPVITLSSDPPLPEDELLLLVLTGSLPQTAQDGGGSGIANMKMAVYLGKGLLSRWFGGSAAEDDESVLQRFDLEFGRQVSKTGQETVEAQFRLIEGLLLPGDRLYITSEKDVYDNVNVGVKIVFRFQ